MLLHFVVMLAMMNEPFPVTGDFNRCFFIELTCMKVVKGCD